MWTRLRARLLNAGVYVACLAWFLCAVAITTGPLGLEASRDNLWVVMLFFLAPVAGMMIVEELVHRIRNGPQEPGRHLRNER